VLPVSSVLVVGTVVAGVFSVTLGVVHLWIPRIFAIDRAIGTDAATNGALGVIRFGGWRYARRRSDAVGLTWVMSNAASYVLITAGLVDIMWAAGARPVSIPIGAAWIAGWWGLRAAGQSALGRRSGDVALALAFVALAAWHVVLVLGAGG
jgi:hypothetical protein